MFKVESTPRNFEIIRFEDSYGESCSLQQSSVAHYTLPGSSAIWLGRNDFRMHLNLDQVKELNQKLESWILTGSFK